MEIGTAIHTAILEPDRFSTEYVLLKDVKDRRKSEYKEAVKIHGTERVLVASEADNVAGMQESVYANPLAKASLETSGFRELSAFVEDPMTGIIMRCRFDLLTADGHALDLKKTQDSRPEEFAKSVYNYRYHVQDAMYSHIYELITGKPLASFEFLAVEEKAPHAVGLFELDAEAKQIGLMEYRRNMQEYAECEEKSDWPAYTEEKQVISLPGWAIVKYEEELEII
jgi:exodeoxyribonuclease VIII